MQAHLPCPDQSFERAQQLFEQTSRFAREAGQQRLPHGQVEQQLRVNSVEMMRALYQGYLDKSALVEAHAARKQAPKGSSFRWRPRSMGCWFGHMDIRREAIYVPEQKEGEYSLDRALELPANHYSQGVQSAVVNYSTSMAFEPAQGFLKDASCEAVSVGTRQMTEIVQHAALDIDDFLEGRNANVLAIGNDTSAEEALLIGSCDATGIEMIKRALREATRKAKANAQCKNKGKNDPMTPPPLRNNSTRMAMVLAVWDQQRNPRTVEQILQSLRRETTEKPEKTTDWAAPQNKVLDASVIEGESQKVKDMLAEMHRRDPEHKRRWIILVDGKTSQLEAIELESKMLGVEVTIVVDLIHVIHYVWQAGKELYNEKTEWQALQEWVEERLKCLLEGQVSEVARGIRQSATKRKLKGKSRETVDKSVDYLLNHKQYLKYNEYLEQGLPIASGVIEGACRHLVNDRMDVTGAKWGLETSEATLRLRALKLHGALEAYLEFHFAREQERLYGEDKAA